MIAVTDDERQRRAERATVAQAGEDLHLVGLDLLAGTSAVALLAAAQVVVDHLAVEDETCRQPGDHGHERGTVRLAGGDEAESAHARERTARCMTSIGAARPVHSSNEAAPWATSTSRPVTTRAPAAAAARAVAVSG